MKQYILKVIFPSIIKEISSKMMSDQEKSKIILQTEQFFGENSPLKRAIEDGGRVYEQRQQQADMALAVARHFHESKHLCLEAPTGIGKTFAYLIPAIFLNKQRGMPVVISTHTINLQEQIIKMDLPLLCKVMDMELKTALAMGRNNYLCKRRLKLVADEQAQFLPSLEQLPAFDRLVEWSEGTKDGCRKSMEFQPSSNLWHSVCCEHGNCLNAKCEFFRHCFFMKARIAMNDADIIVSNHALFFADMGMKSIAESAGAGILPSFAAAILDEGHTIEDTAAQHLGMHISTFSLRRILSRFYNQHKDRGLLVGGTNEGARLAVITAQNSAERFFTQLLEWLEPQDKNPLRYTTPGHIPDLLQAELIAVEREVQDLVEQHKEDGNDGKAQELNSLALQVCDFRTNLNHFLEMRFDNHVYWFERIGRDKQHISLNAVPVDMANLLRKDLFDQDYSVLITSATLGISNSLDYFKRRIGAQGVDDLILDTPYDYQKQVELFIPFNMPNPNDQKEFIPAACKQIKHFLIKTGGKAFVLFTSYYMMHQAAELLEEFFENSNITLFMQGGDLQTSEMLRAFRQDTDSVIFGTASFWTGVDVPGESLSNVIIVKLPFAVPDHPLIAARQEKIEHSGRNSFWDYSLPEAILKFRQGFGRLIRGNDDKGIVVVLDNRIVQKSYGKSFLTSIPECRHTVF